MHFNILSCKSGVDFRRPICDFRFCSRAYNAHAKSMDTTFGGPVGTEPTHVAHCFYCLHGFRHQPLGCFSGRRSWGSKVVFLCRAPQLITTTWNSYVWFQMCYWEACDILILLKSIWNFKCFCTMSFHILGCTSGTRCRFPTCDFQLFSFAHIPIARSIKTTLGWPLGTEIDHSA